MSFFLKAYRETDGLILKKLALQKEATALLKGVEIRCDTGR